MLDLRVSFRLNSRGENAAVDALRLTAAPASVPEPASVFLLGFAAAGAAVRRRRG